MSTEFDQKIQSFSERVQDGDNATVIEEATALLATSTPEVEEYRAVLNVIVGRAYFNQEKFPEAIAAYTKAAEAPDGEPHDWLQLASVYMKTGDMAGADAAFKKGREKTTSSADDLGMVLSFMIGLAADEHYAEAEALLNELKEFYLKLPSLDETYLVTATGGMPPMLSDVLDNALPILEHMSDKDREDWIKDLETRLHDEDKQYAIELRKSFA